MAMDTDCKIQTKVTKGEVWWATDQEGIYEQRRHIYVKLMIKLWIPSWCLVYGLVLLPMGAGKVGVGAPSYWCW